MQRLSDLYKRWSGAEPQKIERLAGAGSNRQYYRITSIDGTTVIGVIGTSQDENHAFITLSKHFKIKELPVPEVYAVSDDEMCYIQSDLGTMALFDALKKGRDAGGQYDESEKKLLVKIMRLLPRIQVLGAQELDFSVCYPQPEFDETNVMFDLNYFKYCFLKPSGVDFHEVRLEEDFRKLASHLISDEGTYFMYRDFQARNIMLDGEANPYLIDYQGGRKGPYYYDVASFLWQASARYPDDLREELIKEYHSALGQYTKVPSLDDFTKRLNLFVFFRILQVLGAYGYRGYFERKKHFIDSIPPALNNLRAILQNDFPYPHLITTLRKLVSDAPQNDKQASRKDLIVRVFSFSYKKGIPEDTSGNGGGYVFDCRSTHNPGRYEPYKKLTGLDEPVIRFLEDDGEILAFLESVYKLADAHVERYIQRGFTDLMFSFGCTGGQHRSVYSAQHLAEYLNRKYGIEVRLCHREQGIEETLEAKAQ
jgi:aminoglycoside/choline kinase family phosphotransferase